MADAGHDGSDGSPGEAIFPLLMGFLLFWLWVAEDFAFSDKLIMTSLVFGLEFLLVVGLTQPAQSIRARESPN